MKHLWHDFFFFLVAIHSIIFIVSTNWLWHVSEAAGGRQILSVPMCTLSAWWFIHLFVFIYSFSCLHHFNSPSQVLSVCMRGENWKVTFHYLEETFHATAVSYIIVQPGGRNYHYDEDTNIECVIVRCGACCVRVCMFVCYTEIAGCHAVSHPMISDINSQKDPTLSLSPWQLRA